MIILCFRSCTEHEFRCSDGSCVTLTWKCDLERDCIDGSDELECGECDKYIHSNIVTMGFIWAENTASIFANKEPSRILELEIHTNAVHNIWNGIPYYCKDKIIPVQAWTGPEVSRLGIPDLQKIST